MTVKQKDMVIAVCGGINREKMSFAQARILLAEKEILNEELEAKLRTGKKYLLLPKC